MTFTEQSLEVEANRTAFAGEQTRSIDFERLFRLLYLHRRQIGRITLAFVIVALVLAFVIRPRYTASASFVPPSSTGGSSAAALAGQLTSALGLGASMGGLKSPGDLYVGMLKSRTIRAMLIQQFDLKTVYRLKKESEAEKELASNSTFEVGIKDSIVSISVTDKSPERARDITNGYLTALKTVSGGLSLTESSQRRLFYENRLAREKEELAAAEVALKQTQEQTGLIAPVGQTASEIQAMAQLRAQLTAREVQLAALRHDETEQSPGVIRIQNEVGSLQSQLNAMETGKKGGPHGGFSSAQVPALELDYIRKTRDVKYHETLFEILAKQYEVARLDEANSTPLQILDHATLPDSKSGPSRVLIIIGGLIGGFVLACCWVLLHENTALPSLIAKIRNL